MDSNHIIQDTYRSKVRTAGLSGDYWYPVEYDAKLKKGDRTEVVFWKQSIALYRDAYGALHALENRCAHRQLKLSLGEVSGCNLVCEYHGWQYAGDGRCVHIPHEMKTKARPDIRVRAYPVKVKYGLIWLFPGDPDKAEATPLPVCAPLDGPKGWRHVPLDFTWKCHHSMITENVCDFYHEHLHRKYKPFYKPRLGSVEEREDKIFVEYEASFSESQIVKVAGDKKTTKLESIQLCYDYPYQKSDIEGRYLHWLFMLPIDEQTTRCFFLFAFGGVQLPVLGWEIPQFLRYPVLRLANILYVKPLLNEDGLILEAEQLAHVVHRNKPVFEFNPIVKKFQALTLRKWDEYLASEAARAQKKEAQRRSEAKDPALPATA